MPYDPNRHHRRSIRLKDFDYSQNAAYFVTLVCKDRDVLLETPEAADFVDDAWRWLATRYERVDLDEYVVMPNHFHGIVVLRENSQGGSRAAPTWRTHRKPLGELIGAFKTVSTRRINAFRDTAGVRLWQRNYYEHVIRNDNEFERIRQYIRDNPSRWCDDPENPAVFAAVGAAREPPS
ncbi:MAG: transposase [Dehalococcoidia bacterium]